MRVLMAAVVCLVLALNASAEVFVHVYRCDGTTPLPLKDPNTPGVFSDIMVGAHLLLVVSSDEPAPLGKWWWGFLLTSVEDSALGLLAGRDFNPNDKKPYESSCLPAAGLCPRVTIADYHNFDRIGFDLMADCDPVAGDWFVFDYYAQGLGLCDVQLFDHGYDPAAGVSPEEGEEILIGGDRPDVAVDFNSPDRTVTLTHVPSRDFNHDHIVNFRDFASLASHWRQEAGSDPAAPPLPDLDADALIGPSDIVHFSDFWLERTDCPEASPEP